MASKPVDEKTNRILVKNLPPNLTRDKLEIYFQRQDHGGDGDVNSVTLPFSTSEKRDAVIELERPETVTSILAKQHQIFGYKLEVLPFSEQEFGETVIEINKGTLKKYNLTDEFLKTVQEDTGVRIAGRNGHVHMMGQWYQVEVAMRMVRSKGGRPAILLPEKSTPPPVKFEKLPVDELAYEYFELCYPGDLPRLSKKCKATVKYQDGKLIFEPARKNGAADLAAAAQSTKSRLTQFSQGLTKQHLSYSGFPLKDMEIEMAIKEVTKKGRVVARRVKGKEEILILATDDKVANEAVNTFRMCCFPEKNECMGVLEVPKQSFRVTVAHGDFRRVKAEALLSQLNENLVGRVLLHCADPTIISWVGHYLQQDNAVGVIGTVLNKPNLEYKWLQHYVVDKSAAGKSNFKRRLTRAIESAAAKYRTAVLPVFIDNETDIPSDQFIGMIAGAIKDVKTNSSFSNLCIVHHNDVQAGNILNYFVNQKKFKLLGMSDPGGTNSRQDSSSEEEICSICLDELSGATPMRTLPCNHAFHQACIDKAFTISKKCPMCMRFYGEPTGNQPRDGWMTSRTIPHQRLPGFKRPGVIEIIYNFPNGTQGSEHPNPGMPYQGTSRKAYLPDNEEGRELLLLLRKAFDARITFTIGRSVTTGRDNVVTWNDIHHKTSMTGGPQGYGYPDPTYLRRLKSELADKGIRL